MSEADEARLLALDNQICFKLYAASRAVTKLYRPQLDELGLTYPQYLVMLVLWEWDREPPETATVSALGDRLRLDSGTLTPLLKRLEARGLLSRSRARHDERIVLVALTAEGKALRERAKPIPAKLVCEARVPAEELLALRRDLDRLLKALEGEQGPS